MGFYIQDDFWEAMEEQPAKVQDEVLGALARLFFTGEASEMRGVSKALFVAFRDRVLIARKRSEAGKSKARSNEDQNGIKTTIKTESKPGSNDDQNDDQNRSDLLKSESESEKERKALDSPNVESRASGRFAPPTPEEVAAYAAEYGAEHGGSLDAHRFCDHYASKGWKIGKTPMKDWKAAARNWMRDDRGGAGNVDLGRWAKPEGSAF
ncbi:hypothetical protein AALA69_03140 [Eggerthellaceae bacterium 24-137]